MAEPLTGVLGADFSKFVEECAKANEALGVLVQSSARMQDSLDKLAKSTDDNEVSWTKLVSSYVSGEVIVDTAIKGFESLTSLLTSTIESATKSEEANSRLMAALQAQGTALPSVIEAYDKYARQLQQTTIYSDDTAKSAETLLAMIGNVMPRDMEAALQATANLASGLKIDLTDAATML